MTLEAWEIREGLFWSDSECECECSCEWVSAFWFIACDTLFKYSSFFSCKINWCIGKKKHDTTFLVSRLIFDARILYFWFTCSDIQKISIMCRLTKFFEDVLLCLYVPELDRWLLRHCGLIPGSTTSSSWIYMNFSN